MRSFAAAAVLAGTLALGCGEPAERKVKPTPGQMMPAAAPVVAQACAAAARVYDGTVRCPTRLPASLDDPEFEFGGRTDQHRPCAWQVGMRLEGSTFHAVFGGQCRPLPLKSLRGGWPADPARVEPHLRLTGRGPLQPGDPASARGPLVRPTLVRDDLTVNGYPAVLVAYAPYPAAGTIHGGHQALIWNVEGEGQVFSAHFDTDVPATLRLELLLAAAKSMRPAP